MVRERQRRRQLARAKWERQQTRRAQSAKRQRRIGIVAGIAFGILASAAAVWLIISIVQDEKANDDNPIPIPTQNTITPLDQLPSSGDTGTTGSEPTAPGSTAPSDGAPSGTATSGQQGN